MSAEIIPIGRGYQLLRGPDAEASRQRRLKICRVAAFNRAMSIDDYSAADVAMFGPIDAILIAGPGQDPRLGRGGDNEVA